MCRTRVQQRYMSYQKGNHNPPTPHRNQCLRNAHIPCHLNWTQSPTPASANAARDHWELVITYIHNNSSSTRLGCLSKVPPPSPEHMSPCKFHIWKHHLTSLSRALAILLLKNGVDMDRLVLLLARLFVVVENALTAAGAATMASFSAVENFMLLY